MVTKIRIVNTILIFIAVFMGIKQGWAMFTGKSEMVGLLDKWFFDKIDLMIFGVVTILSALLILHPKTFIWGNFLMAAGIFLLICFHAIDLNLKGVILELPFLILNLVILYFQHPLQNKL